LHSHCRVHSRHRYAAVFTPTGSCSCGGQLHRSCLGCSRNCRITPGGVTPVELKAAAAGGGTQSCEQQKGLDRGALIMSQPPTCHSSSLHKQTSVPPSKGFPFLQLTHALISGCQCAACCKQYMPERLREATKKIDATIQEYMKVNSIHTAAVGVVYDQELIWEKGYGFIDSSTPSSCVHLPVLPQS
jgi:hypothetical protein